MIPVGRTVEIETHPVPQEESWSSTYESQETDYLDGHEPNWIATIVIGVVFFWLGIAVVQESVGVGVGLVFLGVIIVAGSYSAMKAKATEEIDEKVGVEWEEMEAASGWEEALRARQEARQKEVEEIVKAVKSTIRVRCGYCGTLNEESANKCESCGASL